MTRPVYILVLQLSLHWKVRESREDQCCRNLRTGTMHVMPNSRIAGSAAVGPGMKEMG